MTRRVKATCIATMKVSCNPRFSHTEKDLQVWECLGTTIPRSFHTINVWRGSMYILGGVEGQVDILQELTFNKDFLTQMAEGPFSVMLSYLDAKSIVKLSCTCRELNKKRFFHRK